jgi:hypothetical protein
VQNDVRLMVSSRRSQWAAVAVVLSLCGDHCVTGFSKASFKTCSAPSAPSHGSVKVIGTSSMCKLLNETHFVSSWRGSDIVRGGNDSHVLLYVVNPLQLLSL